MKKLLKTNFIVALLFLSPIVLFAQEKTQAYYNTHESEILPDAQNAFREGDYERTLILCRWQYIIVGDHAAEPLQEKAEQCAQLLKEMEELQGTGMTEAMIEKAKAILAINPDDPAAISVLSVEEPAPIPIPDSVAVTPPLEPIEVVEIDDLNQQIEAEKPTDNPSIEDPQELDTRQESVDYDIVVHSKDNPRTRFVMKAGASMLDLKTNAVAPHATIGVYDLGGSRVGVEVGYCPGLFTSEVTLFVVESALVFRAFKGSYPKIGVGFFNSSLKENKKNTTRGMCGVLGWSFVGKHFSFEIGANYFPTINVLGKETVRTNGGSYDFPTTVKIISSGISPSIGIGLAF